MMKKLSVFLFVLIDIAGCSSLPTELETQSQQPITDYQQWVNSDPDQTADVRLGGVITKVTNLQDKTRLEIVNLPISSAGKPSLEADPKGRFVAYVDGFLDPVTYAKGRLITVAGKSMPPETGKVGDYTYTFPVMQASGQRLWQIEKTTYIDNNDFWIGGCWRGSIFCSSYGPTRARVVEQVK
ncbi:Slp family lipoprotein [Vibrio gangliei]|uniref:Slp family lipoprotein n=1 Tax=Vibrio gangliei TaxID=2077090 RepID=UPI000D014A0F|nr:Slp family lipoprotein [Vibrio gangliei]